MEGFLFSKIFMHGDACGGILAMKEEEYKMGSDDLFKKRREVLT